jgi:hypothetical protein
MKQLLLVGDRNDGLAPTAQSTPQSTYSSPPWRPGRTPVPSACERVYLTFKWNKGILHSYVE